MLFRAFLQPLHVVLRTTVVSFEHQARVLWAVSEPKIFDDKKSCVEAGGFTRAVETETAQARVAREPCVHVRAF